ncbi:MAG: non-heme iron oxygenase ferredoxin subunit [Xanthobacteraceae bacterium]|nr:non-heme iron oxygenase ferredoxin subunit [Xanthobacteraceae bacterium]
MILSSELNLVCAVSDLEPGTAKRIVVGRLALAAFNLDGEFYVTDDTCTHGFASLSTGIIDGHLVECPWHGGTFDIRSGAPVDRPCTVPLTVYRTVVRDGALWVDLGGKPGVE